MTYKPLLLDLCCKAGGASKGYADVGFEIIGVDIEPQPHYPYEFHCADAIEFLKKHHKEFVAVHTSPPCQEYTQATKQWRMAGRQYPRLIETLRDLLAKFKKPYVIENVPDAPLINPITLCGTMFGIKTYRHRIFETSFKVPQPLHASHTTKQIKMGRPVKDGEYIQLVGHFSNVPYGRKVMGIPWMTQHELAEAIPPCYTALVGKYLMKAIK